MKSIKLLVIAAFLCCTSASAQVRAPILLNYHQVGVNTLITHSPTENDLNSHISNLHGHGFQLIHSSKFLESLTRGQQIALLTFDDGRKSVFTNAYPVLESHGVSATAFVIANRIGLEDHMTVENLQELHAAGWEIGNHTLTHAALTDLTPGSIREEIEQTNQIIEEITGERPKCVAYPFGLHDAVVREIVLELNQCGFSTGPSFAHPGTDPTAIPRPPLSGGDNRSLQSGTRAESITTALVATAMLTWPLPDSAPVNPPPASWTPTTFRTLGDGRYSMHGSRYGISHELSAREGPWALHLMHGRGDVRAHAIGIARNFGNLTVAGAYVAHDGPGFGIAYDFGRRTEPWAYWTLNGGLRTGIRLVPLDYTSFTATYDFRLGWMTFDLSVPLPVRADEGYPLRIGLGYEDGPYGRLNFRLGGNSFGLRVAAGGNVSLQVDMRW